MKLGQQVYIIVDKTTKKECTYCNGEPKDEKGFVCPECKGEGKKSVYSKHVERGVIVQLAHTQWYDLDNEDKIIKKKEEKFLFQYYKVLMDGGKITSPTGTYTTKKDAEAYIVNFNKEHGE